MAATYLSPPHSRLSVGQWLADNVEGDLPGDLPGNAEELLKVLRPHPPVPIPVFWPLFEQLVRRFPTLKDNLVAAEFDELTLHFPSFIFSHLRPLGRTTMQCHITVF